MRATRLCTAVILIFIVFVHPLELDAPYSILPCRDLFVTYMIGYNSLQPFSLNARRPALEKWTGSKPFFPQNLGKNCLVGIRVVIMRKISFIFLESPAFTPYTSSIHLWWWTQHDWEPLMDGLKKPTTCVHRRDMRFRRESVRKTQPTTKCLIPRNTLFSDNS